MSENVRVERQDGIAVVTLCRPPANALDLDATDAVAEVFADLGGDDAVRAVVLTGEGKAFCAGLDLKRVPQYDAADQDRLLDALNRAFYNVYRMPVPVVCAVNGHAIAGGMVLVLCTDKRIADDGDYMVGVTEVRVGVPYPLGGIEVCRAELAPADFRNLALFGQTVQPAQAHRMGVFDEMVSTDRLMDRALEQADTLARLPRDGFVKIKNQMRRPVLAQMRAAVEDRADPLFGDWLSDETMAAAAAMLRGG